MPHQGRQEHDEKDRRVGEVGDLEGLGCHASFFYIFFSSS